MTIFYGQIQWSFPIITFWVLVMDPVQEEAADVQATISCSQMEGSDPIIILWVLLLNLVHDQLTDV